MIVVPVLITNCQVSLNLKSGPVMIQMAMMPTAIENVIGLPLKRAVFFASVEYQVFCVMAESIAVSARNANSTSKFR
jgi:hypothetical protein